MVNRVQHIALAFSQFVNANCYCQSPSLDVIYTGTADGKIVKIEGKSITVIARLGKPPCGKGARTRAVIDSSLIALDLISQALISQCCLNMT